MITTILELEKIPGEIYIIHAGPTAGKSKLFKKYRAKSPRETGLLFMDTDDVTWVCDPAHFLHKKWKRGGDPTDAIRPFVEYWCQCVQNAGELTGVILTNLWGLFPPDAYDATYFPIPQEMVHRSKIRGTPIPLGIAKEWFASWSTHNRIDPHFIMEEDDYLSDLIKFI